MTDVSDNLSSIMERISSGTYTSEDVAALRDLLETGDRQTILQLGKYNIQLGDRKEILIGDRIYNQWDEQAIQALVKAIQQAAPKNVPTQFQSLIADKTEGFVGREYVFDAINAFIANNPKGYFNIIGDPGQGKSAILAKYVLDTGCVAHFNIFVEGINRADQFLESICRQLVIRYDLPYDPLPPRATQDGEFLSQLLEEVARQVNGQAIVIAVDALDEVDSASYRDANILYLPPHLPDGVYFILTRRRVEIPLTVYVPIQTIDLANYQSQNQQDIRNYIYNFLDNSEQLRHQIDERGETVQEFVNSLAQKSQDNFMYLRFILQEIESGLYKDLDLERFPNGLQGYYEVHWRRMGMMDRPILPEEQVKKVKIIYILSEVRQPISVTKICDFSGESSSSSSLF